MLAAALSAATWAPLAVAAPPPAATATEPEAEPGLDPSQSSDEYKALYGEGRELFESGDYAGAIDKWQQAYGLTPCESRKFTRVDLADALQKQHENDHDVQHLYRAQGLLEDQFRELDPSDEYELAAREDIPSMLEDVNAKIVEAERELAEQANKLARLEAEAEAAREHEILREKQLEAQLQQEKRTRRFGLGLAGVVTGIGVAASGAIVWAYDGRCSGDLNDPQTCPNLYETTAIGAVTVGIGAALIAGSSVLVARGYPHAKSGSGPGAGPVDRVQQPGLIWVGAGGLIAGAGVTAGGVVLLGLDGQCSKEGGPACDQFYESTSSGTIMVGVGSAVVVAAATLVGFGLRGPTLRAASVRLDPGGVLRF